MKEDPVALFAKMFGGESFVAYVSRFSERPVTVGLISRSGRRNRIGEDDELDHQDESRGDG